MPADVAEAFPGITLAEWERLHALPPEDAWATAPPTAGERLALARNAGAGPAAAAHLAALDPTALLAQDKVRLVQAWETVIAWAQAGQARALAALDTRHPEDDAALVLDPTVTDVEVRAALRLAPGVASARLHLARELATRLAPTAAALGDGRISLAHAQVMSDGLAGVVDPALLGRLQDQVLPLAATRTPAATRVALAKALHEADPERARERHEAARADRHVRVFPLPDGMGCLQVTAPAEQVQQAFACLTAAAQACPAVDGESVDARRADLALAALTRTDADLPAPRRPRVLLTVPASTLLGCDDAPALLAGYGWTTADAARRVATDATWQRVLTDPASGAVLDVGQTAYRPPADLARFVAVRDRTCRAPHCPRPAHQCDLDHVVAFDDGGPTSAANVQASCRHDHRAKTSGGWSVTRHDDGSATWTSARGITHAVPPPEPPPATIRPPGGPVVPRLDGGGPAGRAPDTSAGPTSVPDPGAEAAAAVVPESVSGRGDVDVPPY